MRRWKVTYFAMLAAVPFAASASALPPVTQVPVITSGPALDTAKANLPTLLKNFNADMSQEISRRVQAVKASSNRVQPPLTAAAPRVAFDVAGFNAKATTLSNPSDSQQRAALRANIQTWAPQLARVWQASGINWAAEQATLLAALNVPQNLASSSGGGMISVPVDVFAYIPLSLINSLRPDAGASKQTPPAPQPTTVNMSPPFGLVAANGPSPASGATAGGSFYTNASSPINVCLLEPQAMVGGLVQASPGTSNGSVSASVSTSYNDSGFGFGGGGDALNVVGLWVFDSANLNNPLCVSTVTIDENFCIGACASENGSTVSNTLQCSFSRDPSTSSTYQIYLEGASSACAFGGVVVTASENSTVSGISVTFSP